MTRTLSLVSLLVLGLPACRAAERPRHEPASGAPRLVTLTGATRAGALEFRATSELVNAAVGVPFLRTRVTVHNAGPDTLYLYYGQCATSLRLFATAALGGAPVRALGGERECLLMGIATALAPAATVDSLFTEEVPLPVRADGPDGSALASGTYYVAADVDVHVARSLEQVFAAPPTPGVRVPAGVLALGH